MNLRAAAFSVFLAASICGAGNVVAAPCFDKSGDIVAGPNCRLNPPNAVRPKADEVLANDESGQPLYKALVVSGKPKNLPDLIGIADMSGRVIAPAKFRNVYIVSRHLGVGEASLDPRKPGETQRAFLIDLSTGGISATPYRAVRLSVQGYAAGSPYLLGVMEEDNGLNPTLAALLLPDGTDTGVILKSTGQKITTRPNGLVSVGDELFTVEGKPPAGGRKIYDGMSDGYFAEIGPPPTDLVSGPVGPLYQPLNSVGELNDLPPGVVGVVKGGVAWWSIRRTPNGPRFYRHEWGAPVLTPQPVGEAYLGLRITERSDVVKTSKGWMNIYNKVLFATEEEAARATDAQSKAFVAAVMKEETDKELKQAQAAANAKTEQAARTAAARQAVQDRIARAKAEGWGGWKLSDLKNDVIAFQLEGEYQSAGLYIDARMKRDICWQRQSSICDYSSSQSSSSGSGFESTWEKAFENARNLNQSQYNENCAAASMGASRACTRY